MDLCTGPPWLPFKKALNVHRGYLPIIIVLPVSNYIKTFNAKTFLNYLRKTNTEHRQQKINNKNTPAREILSQFVPILCLLYCMYCNYFMSKRGRNCSPAVSSTSLHHDFFFKCKMLSLYFCLFKYKVRTALYPPKVLNCGAVYNKLVFLINCVVRFGISREPTKRVNALNWKIHIFSFDLLCLKYTYIHYSLI